MFSADYCGHGNTPMRPFDGHWQMDPTRTIHLPDCQYAVVQPGHEVDGALLRSSSEPSHTVGSNECRASDTRLVGGQEESALSGNEVCHVDLERQPLNGSENTDANGEQSIIPITSFCAPGEKL